MNEIRSKIRKVSRKGREGISLRCSVVSALGIGLALCMGPMSLLRAATFNVDRIDDNAARGCRDDTPNDCSLRGAILAANVLPDLDIINLPNAGRAADGSQRSYALTFGSLRITNDLTIKGDRANVTIIDGRFEVLNVLNAELVLRVNFEGLTIQGGKGDEGGGILVGDNTFVQITSCIIRENFAEFQGGGILIASRAGLRLTNSTVKNNRTNAAGFDRRANGGGGIANYGDADIIRSTINNNSAPMGAGIYNDGELELRNSTVSGNEAFRNDRLGGGGILNNLGLSISFSTITKNKVNFGTGSDKGVKATGGGIHNTARGRIEMANTILADNDDNRIFISPRFGDVSAKDKSLASPDCLSKAPGHFRVDRDSLIGILSNNCDMGVHGPLVGNFSPSHPIDPRLSPLADHGGPTQTHAIVTRLSRYREDSSDSQAIDGDVGRTVSRFFDCPDTDQRGFPRPVDGDRDGRARCDIGGFEFAAMSQPTIRASASGTTNDRGTPKTITASMSFDPVSGGASGRVIVDPPSVCLPCVAGKVFIWQLKSSKPADGLTFRPERASEGVGRSLLDIAGGDLGGTLRMIDEGTGTNITASFRLTRMNPDIQVKFQVDAQYDSTIDLTGLWSSSETIVAKAAGEANATGQSLFRRTDGSEIVMPYTVSYQFLGDPSAQLLNPIQASQSVNLDLATGNFIAQTTARVLPTSINDLVTFDPLGSTFSTTSDTTGCPTGFEGKFGFDARLKITNEHGSSPLSGIIVEVRTLTGGNLLQNADYGPGGVGATLTVPGVLRPGEFVDVPFGMCLTEKEPFTFFVDVLGVAVEGGGED